MDFKNLSLDEAIDALVQQKLESTNVVDLKELIKENSLTLTNKKTKADLVAGIKNQPRQNISGIIEDCLRKKMTVPDLKNYLKLEGQPVAGKKEELITRLMELKNILERGDDGTVVGGNPKPLLSEKEMGPDVDMVHEEYPHLQPYRLVKNAEDIETIAAQKPKIRQLKFDSNLSVKGADLDRVLEVCGLELLVLELGDQEIGSRVDCDSAEVIARHCPRLQKLYMESCGWTDKEAILVGFCCPRLRFLKISGNDKISGNLGTRFISKLADDRSFLKKLRLLSLVDNRADYKKVEILSRKRRNLTIRDGESDSGNWWGSRGEIFERRGGKFNFF